MFTGHHPVTGGGFFFGAHAEERRGTAGVRGSAPGLKHDPRKYEAK